MPSPTRRTHLGRAISSAAVFLVLALLGSRNANPVLLIAGWTGVLFFTGMITVEVRRRRRAG